ncbi:aromatic prenyltransferase [Fusarium solani]|jgi:DMATS type aromatic prenyltransferase|uniref:Aromatic prenyltransferase n=1 Tax=Fusarium solani TaxID=169388 RepID=A0A9P9HY87_FUSSL|nr:aromatic prenyltransferase [Fusarium solani]KAH7266118.1 aromatic prenyltransferase [Fusarium solani]
MATSESISRQTKPWHLVKARHESLFNPHQRYWYQNAGYVLASLLNNAGYTQMSQINILHHFANLVTPYLGSAFRIGLTRWRSFMTDDFTPVQLSWDFHTGTEKPTVCYSIEPIGLDAGTAVNLQNARAAEDFKKGLLEAFPETNATLFDHFRSCFDQLWIGAGPGHQSTMFWGLTLEENTITNKAYFFPCAMARATHQPTLAVIRGAVESAPGYSQEKMASFKLFTDYVSQRPELRLEIEMFALDLTQEDESKLKVYFRDRRTNFEAVKEMMSLGGRLQGPSFEMGIRKLRRLWDALLGTQGVPENIALPYKNHRTAGILYHFEFGMDGQTPKVRVYIPVRHYAENDQQVLDALTGFIGEEVGNNGSQAFLESATRYSECLQSTL